MDKKDPFTPASTITSAFELLQGAKIFTKLELRKAYHLVRIREEVEKWNEWMSGKLLLTLLVGITNIL